MQKEQEELQFYEEDIWEKGITLQREDYEEFEYQMLKQDTTYQDLYRNKLSKNDSINLY